MLISGQSKGQNLSALSRFRVCCYLHICLSSLGFLALSFTCQCFPHNLLPSVGFYLICCPVLFPLAVGLHLMFNTRLPPPFLSIFSNVMLYSFLFPVYSVLLCSLLSHPLDYFTHLLPRDLIVCSSGSSCVADVVFPRTWPKICSVLEFSQRSHHTNNTHHHVA